MPITSNPVYSTGDTIEALIVNNLNDSINVLDARTGGDPGAAGKLIISTSDTAGTWTEGGSGSGVHADTVDGYEASGLARLNATSNFTTLPTYLGNNLLHAGLLSTLALLAGSNSFTGTNNFTQQPTYLGNPLAFEVGSGKVGHALVADSALAVADGIITLAKMAAAASDAAAGTASLRSLGTGAQQAAAGNHTHTAMARIATGDYTGTGTLMSETGVGFEPKAVFISRTDGAAFGFALGNDVMWTVSPSPSAGATQTAAITLSSDGFSFSTNHALNVNSVTYQYVAIG